MIWWRALPMMAFVGCSSADPVAAGPRAQPLEPTSITSADHPSELALDSIPELESGPEVVDVIELAPASLLRQPPEGWVDLAKHIEGVRLDIRYHTSDNFTEQALPGYGVPGAWLQQAPADALVRVQAALAAHGLGLLVYDAYRPLRGTLGMVAWAERTNQVFLLDNGYIARRSGHNTGNTVDLTMVDLATGALIDMGTAWDTLTEASHTRNITGPALENRLQLRAAMEREGWKNYHKEWWHYSYAMEGPLPHRDVPYACFEPDEGEWEAPAGWDRPDFAMPRWPSSPSCETSSADSEVDGHPMK